MPDAYPAGFVAQAQPPRLTATDRCGAAAMLGVSVAKICAVCEVESRGRGFDPDTGRPIILFEPHVFHARTGGRFDGAVPDLSYAEWGALPYPASQRERYDQLRRACELDETAALQSVSWGLFQIMGYNFKPAGFVSVQGFVAAMCRGEGDQLAAFAAFIKAWPPLWNALRLGDWSGFARLYNGPAYAQHGYDQKLKAAFARLRDLPLAGMAAESA